MTRKMPDKVFTLEQFRKEGRKVTPMLRQYMDIKEKYPDAILFYRMGDFYEMFFEDAVEASRILDITLTSRDRKEKNPVPMCGVPCHAAEGYLATLVQAGKRVAVCEQVEEPGQAKGLVRREVVRVVTPGLLAMEGSFDAATNNYIVAIQPGGRQYALWALASLDISTGEFRVTELPGEEDVLAEVFRLAPSEILLPEEMDDSETGKKIREVLPSVFFSFRSSRLFRFKYAGQRLMEHFGTLSLDGFGLSGMRNAVSAAGALLAYALETQKGQASHITSILPYSINEFLVIDEATRRNLELVLNTVDYTRKGSLLDLLDFTVTAMGGRLFRKWLLYPLVSISDIKARQDAVQLLVREYDARRDLRNILSGMYDMERLLGRVVLGTANARDLLALKQSIQALPGLVTHLETLLTATDPDSACTLLDTGNLDLLEETGRVIEDAIREDCPLVLRDGRLIKEGFNQELDELIHIQRDGRGFIAGVERREREKTGISSLKVGYNRVFGYYIEVSKAHVDKVPEEYIRKQTLVSAERYITPELKEIENRILSAQEKRLALEYECFLEVLSRVADAREAVQQTAAFVAVVDALASMAEAADRYDYIRPVVNDGTELLLEKARHPVVEHTGRENFVPNDIRLNHKDATLVIITGPNMAGKSTVLRQTAIIVLMAQMGSFVPAERAVTGVCDRIFSRVGATDYLSRGQSTFMVEMSETAAILHNATRRSLVILDEIGRGTSTYDGLSLAWAVADYLVKKDGTGIRTLFATHYHELTDIEKEYGCVKNMHMSVRESGDTIAFLRVLREGPANKSYGIHVAALAGVPDTVIKHAFSLLEEIERSHLHARPVSGKKTGGRQGRGNMFQNALPLVVDRSAGLRKKIEQLDINNITPVQAMNFLKELQDECALFRGGSS